MRTTTFYRVGPANFLTIESALEHQHYLMAEHNLEMAVYKVEHHFVGEELIGEVVSEI